MVFITLSLPSGVGVYWVVSNIFSLIASYYVYGRRILTWRQLLPVPLEAPAPTASQRKERSQSKPDIEGEATVIESNDEPDADATAQREARTHGKRRGKRKKRG